MEERKTIWDYAVQTLCLYGVMVLLLSGLCLLFGESAKEISGLFALGSEGLSLTTLGQYMILAILTTLARIFFFRDTVIKNGSLALRTAGMMGTEVGIIVVCVFIWGWFPVDMWEPWVMFALCFTVCAGCSTFVVAWKEKRENRKMDEALKRLKQEGMK